MRVRWNAGTRRAIVARAHGEEGYVLPVALAFMLVIGVAVAYVLGFADTSVQSTSRLDAQRDALFAANGAVNSSIKFVQNDPAFTAGAASDGTCNPDGSGGTFLTEDGVNARNASVACVATANSGQGLESTSAPPFAILTLAPYTAQWDSAPFSSSSNTYPTCSSISTAPNAELGIVMVQDSKLVTINGNVYVNSDVDADVWSGGCPQVDVAQAIHVNGNVKVREGCNDMYPTTPEYSWLCSDDGPHTPHQAPRQTNGSLSASDLTLQDPAIANPASWAPEITSAPPVQAVPTCPAGNLVTFSPGTYNNAVALSTLMNGVTCPGRLFWFQPGKYYFNFTNAGSREWTINDSSARIVAGQPNGVPQGSMPIGPVTVVANDPPPPATSSPGFTTPLNGLRIDGTTTGTGAINNATLRWVRYGGYDLAPDIPSGATDVAVQLRVRHRETEVARIAALRVTVRNANNDSEKCQVPIAPSVDMVDTVVAVPPGCLAINELNGGAFRLRYEIQRVSAIGGANPSTVLDGMELDVSYTAPERPAWNPADPGSVTEVSPGLPGACRKDGDVGWTDGVQWLFGGDSRINLRSGAVELCDIPSTTKQEIVLYGVKAASGSGAGQATLVPSNASATAGSWSNAGNGISINGAVATANFSGSSSGTTATIALTSLTPSLNIDPASTGLTTTLRIAHAGSNNDRLNGQQIVIRPAGGGAPFCTVTVADSSSLSPPQQPAIPAGCLTFARLNAGVEFAYSVTYSCSGVLCFLTSANEQLDGIELQVSWTPPPVTGGLTPASGCIVQKPYYNPSDHSPGHQGACALVKVDKTNAVDGAGAPALRKLTFWGTVYAPSAALDVPVDVMTVPIFGRGVVARTIMLGYQVANSTEVPLAVTPLVGSLQNRRMTLTSSVEGATTKVIADVEFCDYGCDPLHPVGTVKIWSWKVLR